MSRRLPRGHNSYPRARIFLRKPDHCIEPFLFLNLLLMLLTELCNVTLVIAEKSEVKSLDGASIGPGTFCEVVPASKGLIMGLLS